MQIQRKYIYYGIGAVLIVAVLLFIFYGKGTRGMFADGRIVKDDVDSIKKQNAVFAKQIKALNEKSAQDSLRLVNIEVQLKNLPTILNQINKSYNEKKSAYSVLPFDKRFILFAGFLSEIDTASK